MKKSATRFLQFVIILIGLGAFILLLFEPRLEGRNAGATFAQIYFHDPFLAYLYLGSIPFFVALYQAFTLLGLVAHNNTFSKRAVRALRMIKYCALLIIAFVVGAMVYIRFFGGEDDSAGALMLGILIALISVVVSTAAALFEKTLQHAVDIKAENDLTV